MAETLALWSHALAALLFAALGIWVVRAGSGALPRWPTLAVLATTVVWALAVAGLGGADSASRLADGLRNLTLLGFLFALHRGGPDGRSFGLGALYLAVAGVILAGIAVQLVSAALPGSRIAGDAAGVAIVLRLIVGVAALVLVQSVHSAADRGAVRIAALAAGVIWFADVNLTVVASLAGQFPAGGVALRGFVVALAAAMFARALEQGDRPPLRVSRTIAYQAMTVAGLAAYLIVLAVVGASLAAVGGTSGRIYQTAFVIGLTAAVLTLVSSSWLRAWIKVKVAKHLFTHRYDYRSEWLRFTGTLGDTNGGASLGDRVVTAVANLAGAPGGLLLVPDGAGLGVAARPGWRGASHAGDAGFERHLASGDRIIALDDLRSGVGPASELATVPQWLIDEGDAWAVIPLLHGPVLAGAIVLARPAVDRALDWEDFDILRVAGRQVASYLAEARARDQLAEGQRFDEFNRRFAFIAHDIKNLASGLALVARNAERHAENAEFRADMVATLQDSAAKLNALLARLSVNHRSRQEPAVAVPLRDLAARLATARRAVHPVIVAGDAGAVALAGPARLEQAVEHLLTNAIEASPATEPVTIEAVDLGDEVAIVVADRGYGMAPDFVRNQLFRPFASSKPAGFGIGAFEARQLAEAMGGRIEVDSREGEGTRFRIILPAARATLVGEAA